MAMKTRLLNSTVDIVSLGTTKNASGDYGGNRTTVVDDWPCRIVRNTRFGQSGVDEAGPIAVATHIAMGNPDAAGNWATVREGDLLVDGSREYIIILIDLTPGGTQEGDKAHHYEIFLRSSQVNR